MSAAFDMIDHSTLINQISFTFGIKDTALQWLMSYFDKCSSFVTYVSGRSAATCFKIGVPQGSSLEPLLFALYILPLANVTKAHGVNYHQYADDMQLYLSVDKQDRPARAGVLKLCTEAIYILLSHNSLKLNPSKLEAVQFGAAK